MSADIENIAADLHDLIFTAESPDVGTDYTTQADHVQLIAEHGEIHFMLDGHGYMIKVQKTWSPPPC